MMPWVQQWRSDAFSPALECQLILQKNRQILLTGCWHNTTQKHHTKTTSASLLRTNLPKKHVCHKPQPIYHLTMPIEQTVFVRCPDVKRGSISKGAGTGLTLNDKGEVALAPGPLPASSSGTVVAAALVALTDSTDSDKDLYHPVIHAPPGPRTNRFPKKAPTKTEITAERKAAKAAKAVKEVKQKEARWTLKHLEVAPQLKGSCGWQIWIPPSLHPLSHGRGLSLQRQLRILIQWSE
jgi:hypothetical protein